MSNQKVLVAMSGGVDSSVAALMMKKKGYEVVGVFMKNWSGTKNELGECSWREERRMAAKIASSLNIPLMTLDLEKKYKKEVVEEMFRKYKKGITPNPDIDCNKKIKFPGLIKFAKKIGADFVVTGHYARIKKVRIKKNRINEKSGISSIVNKSYAKRGDKNRVKYYYKLFRGKDESKDQSYFLYTLTQNELKNSFFPVGDYTKKEIRKIAKKSGFPNFDKKSTVGICFIGKINLKKFLQKKLKAKKGKILNPEGNIIGEHDGIYYYTIGQRLGSRYGFEIDRRGEDNRNVKKWYVARKDARKNIIIAAPEGHPLLYRKEIVLTEPHWINKKPKNNEKILSRIRQVGELIPSTIKDNKIILNKAITGVSDGQAIVLYKGEEVLGGGVIRF